MQRYENFINSVVLLSKKIFFFFIARLFMLNWGGFCCKFYPLKLHF